MADLPNLLSLKAFEAVARHKNIAKAADELCVTRSAVSQQLKQLEEYLNIKLIDRANNKINLTHDAMLYAAELSKFFQGLRFATRQLIEAQQTHRVTLNLPTTYAMYWLIPQIQDFEDQYPDIELRISTPMRNVNFDLADIDLAIHYGQENSWPTLRTEYLFSEDWLPVCSPRYATKFAQGERRYIEVADTERKMAWQLWCQQYHEAAPTEAQILPVPHTMQAIQAAKNGLGIACVTKLFVENELQNGSLVLPFGERCITAPSAFYLLSPITNERQEVQKVREWLLKIAR